MKILDLTGKQFGKWLVLRRCGSYLSRNGKYRRPTWECRCACGIVRKISGDNLRAGFTKGCRACYCLPKGEAAFNDLLNRYKKGAKDRQIEWQLSNDDFRSIIVQPCDYCGSEPNSIWPKTEHLNGVFIYSGIDRVDSDGPYSVENGAPCCATCNYMKRNMTRQQFLDHIALIASKSAKLEYLGN